MAAVASAAAFNGVEDLGEVVVRQRWRLTPAAALATAGRGGSSVRHRSQRQRRRRGQLVDDAGTTAGQQRWRLQ
jgi:hypothetical protein